MDTFNLKRYLIENKLTRFSKLEEARLRTGPTPEERQRIEEAMKAVFSAVGDLYDVVNSLPFNLPTWAANTLEAEEGDDETALIVDTFLENIMAELYGTLSEEETPEQEYVRKKRNLINPSEE